MLVDRRNEEEDEEEEDCPCEETSKVLMPYIPSSDNPQICVTMETAIAFVNRSDLYFEVNHYDKMSLKTKAKKMRCCTTLFFS